MKIATACVLIILFYFSILSFARFVYPYIPAGKGGGDYTLSQPVQITFDSAFTNSIPQPVKDGIKSATIILLDENSSFAFLANLNDGGGRETWRTTNKPAVYEIRREAITSITYFNPVVTNQNNNTKPTSSLSPSWLKK